MVLSKSMDLCRPRLPIQKRDTPALSATRLAIQHLQGAYFLEHKHTEKSRTELVDQYHNSGSTTFSPANQPRFNTPFSMAAIEVKIDTRQMRYTGEALVCKSPPSIPTLFHLDTTFYILQTKYQTSLINVMIGCLEAQWCRRKSTFPPRMWR